MKGKGIGGMAREKKRDRDADMDIAVFLFISTIHYLLCCLCWIGSKTKVGNAAGQEICCLMLLALLQCSSII